MKECTEEAVVVAKSMSALTGSKISADDPMVGVCMQLNINIQENHNQQITALNQLILASNNTIQEIKRQNKSNEETFSHMQLNQYNSRMDKLNLRFKIKSAVPYVAALFSFLTFLVAVDLVYI